MKIDLPYNIGDTLYRVYDNSIIVDTFKIENIMIAKDHITIFDDSCTMYDSELIGDVVFLSKVDAEKRIKELEKINEINNV